ncbi:hypothetical protein D3C76_1625750 [compost metagenome]
MSPLGIRPSNAEASSARLLKDSLTRANTKALLASYPRSLIMERISASPFSVSARMLARVFWTSPVSSPPFSSAWIFLRLRASPLMVALASDTASESSAGA